MLGFPGGTNGREQPTNAGDVREAGSIPGLERSPGEGNGLENPMEEELAVLQSIGPQGFRLT